MDPTSVPLVDELVSALAAAREEIRRLHGVHTPHYEGKIGEPDLEIASQADAAISRFELERDRTDLDSATLPTRLVITIENGTLSACITDSPHAIEVAVISYDVPDDWDGEDMVMVPQAGGAPSVAGQGFLLRPGHLPDRVRELHRAVYRAGCFATNTTEH
jgi:hypothetical protein